jgi:hypothetical protein
MVIKDFEGITFILTVDASRHIEERHPEITIEVIHSCLKNPDEVRQSLSRNNSFLYYKQLNEKRFHCLVTVIFVDEHYISTAYTTDKIKKGKSVYSRF